ncbi:MAG: hypothetical protein IIA59_08310 [Candidatus Marinimicrobia bacterium]|nr:hypothetical protein [Candidatus Neomarinimicrobiota bacterium]
MAGLSKCAHCLSILTLSAAPLFGWQQQPDSPAQSGTAQSDSTLTDSVAAAPVAWTERMVATPQDRWGPDLLRHPWDVWGHSDIAATWLNPLVPGDIRVGAALLDGSTAAPVLSVAIPAATRAVKSIEHDDDLWGAPVAVAFKATPLNAGERATQTFFYWDQGDFGFRDVQVGTVINLSPGKNLMIAAQGMAHPGPRGRSVPEAVGIANFLLQNYLIDYRGTLSERVEVNYTLLHQQEGTGLPYWTPDSVIDADVRRSDTWSQGLSARWNSGPVSLKLYGSVLTATLVTAPSGAGTNYLDRRSQTAWLGGQAAYRINERVAIQVTFHGKNRAIQDGQLGFLRVSSLLGSLRAHWAQGGLAVSGGLGATSAGFHVELSAALAGKLGRWRLSHESVPYLDFPHFNRVATGGSTFWIDRPSLVQRTVMEVTFERRRLQLGIRAAQFLSPDGPSAVSAGGQIQLAPWPEVLSIKAAVVAVQSDLKRPLPVWVNASGSLTLTLPLKRTRAKPFVSLKGILVGSDFTWWLDPRYGDLAPLDRPDDDLRSMTFWGTYEMGIKVRQFELRYGRINFTSQTVQNSPIYLSPLPMTHYSLTWQFFPPDD